METDKFFFQLFQQLPETLFAALGRPVAEALDYRFHAAELKNTYRLDGLFIPSRKDLPHYFLEVQFQLYAKFHVNHLAKAIGFIDSHDLQGDWVMVAIFPSRKLEPKPWPSVQDLLSPRRYRPIYLDELVVDAHASPGLKIMDLVTAPERDLPDKVRNLRAVTAPKANCANRKVIVELLEEILIRRFPGCGR